MSQAALFEDQNQRTNTGGLNSKAVWQSSFSRDEMNLAEFPLAVLSTRANPKIKTLEFSDVSRAPSGEMIERKWIITGADKFGLPTSTDDDVVLGLMRLSMAHGFRERKVYFTRYELLKTLRWSTEGRSYSRLVKSLDRLSGVRIRSTNSFYDNDTKSYQTVNFGLIDSYEINDCRRGPGEDEQKSFFVWSDQLFDSFKAGYIKKLDLELYFRLKSAVGRRLYRYLDKHFYYKSSVERPLMQFAFEKIGLSRSYKYVSSVKQQLEPALEELVDIGFLHSYEVKGRGAGATIRFNAARAGEQKASSEIEKPTIISSSSPQGVSSAAGDITLAEKLIERGMAAPQARRLIGQVPRAKHERILKIIAYYDQLVANNDYKVSKNKVGFLYRAVERSDDFSLPEENKQTQSRSKRADLKVFRAPKPKRSEDKKLGRLTALDKATKQAAPSDTSELSKAMASLSADELAEVYAQVEEKMRCFKAILDESRYREAVDGCVREELMRRLSLN